MLCAFERVKSARQLYDYLPVEWAADKDTLPPCTHGTAGPACEKSVAFAFRSLSYQGGCDIIFSSAVVSVSY